MTILTQAETIRDETTPSANTALRVGTCLVDIAEVIEAEPEYCFASVSGNASKTTIATPGTFVAAAISGLTDQNSNGWVVGANGLLTYSPGDNKTRLFHITATASVFCDTGSHVIYMRLGDASASDAATTSANTTANSATKQTQQCVSGLFLVADGDQFCLWVTEAEHAEQLTITHLNFTAVPVGVYAVAP
jgi:hypothetical protein